MLSGANGALNAPNGTLMDTKTAHQCTVRSQNGAVMARFGTRKRLDKIQKIILIGGQEVGRTGGVDGLASLRRKRLLTGVHIHPKVFVMVAMDRRLVSVMMTMVDEQLIKLR
jgi:hypothetical protein